MLILAIYTNEEDPQTITECYQFKFKYLVSGPTMDFASNNKKISSTVSCSDTKKASILLIRKLYVLMQSLRPLPNDICLKMKLSYYDEGNVLRRCVCMFTHRPSLPCCVTWAMIKPSLLLSPSP
ncbi:HORMA domain-containing protein 1-like [Chiloscyllium plagiosum]|uniref:HORMA domain-containing protein 1-like n=1 Tax=Chiloscyllium plagiosum TaxID=36176 RepID=UPI001CB7C6F6|nr:HORMA domain-containing protein 1-like [Chiloscyllium plagiosum]